MSRSPYGGLLPRLLANTEEPSNAQGCWQWTRGKDRWGYGRLNVWIPSEGKAKTLMAHIVSTVLYELGECTVDEMYAAYQTHVASGLEFDHLCENEGCCNPDHMEQVTAKVNSQRRSDRVRHQREGR